MLNVLRVRKWIILQAVVLVPLVAAGLSLFLQDAKYEASSQVLISRTNLGNVLTGTQDPAATEFDFNRIVQTQANLATTPRVAQRTLDAAGVTELTPDQFLAASSVATDPNTDILKLVVTDGNEERVVRLATEYGRQFVAYKQDAAVNRLVKLRQQLTDELARLSPRSPLAAQNRAQLQRIRNLESLGDSSISVVQTAREAEQTQPKPIRNAILGLVLGLIIGIGLAFIFDQLDSRLRRSGELEERLGLPLLARLPAPARDLRKNDRLAMLTHSSGPAAENFRNLRTNLIFADVDHSARSIIISSAVQSEGKSTTVANLAVALARAGQHVVLADLDFRRPYLERFFDLPREPGATDVVLGRATLEDALADIPLETGESTPMFQETNGNGGAPTSGLLGNGRLEVLPTGALPPNVGEFVTSEALRTLIVSLRDRGDLLLIDAPPLLQVGDAMALTANVDAVLIVARLGVVRRQMVDEVRRLLATSPAPTLGVVITDATVEPGVGYGYYYAYGYGETRRGGSPAPPTRVS